MKKLRITCALLTILSLSIAGCGSKEINVTPVNAPVASSASESASETVSETPSETETVPEVPATTINLVAVGDMLMHGSASVPALQADGTFNYDYLFDHVRNDIATADVAIANNEVVMAGNEIGNVGYPCFNVRTELATAEVNAGFDVILSATNHCMDQGLNGLINTANFWKNTFPEIGFIGAYATEEDAANIYVKDVNGIKIAMLNYTYDTNVPCNSSYSVGYLTDENAGKIVSDIQRAKEISDFVIVFPHWGTEYVLGTTDFQTKWAQFFADNGVDLVIGTHPHVIEPVQWVTGANGNQMLVYYSLGNFVSVQYYNYSMLGGMAKVAITKDSEGTHISDYSEDLLVTHYTSGRATITTYKLSEYTDELASQHAILTEPGENFMAVNKEYPFTVEGLKNIAKMVSPEFVN